ncbi:hypothetical protein [Brumimicrobium mesophilum]|uniref:hypothetical protein n=1 Tax=Brumimicrobium mesophilum TaxID=392717 RepID=UPI000D142B04|nr:hypothetical protein [Brumimicrobium mesophilum]
MKERLLTNWTILRVIYLVLGTMVIVQTAMSREWIGVLFGAYFVSMGLFAFGCASGNCSGGNCSTDSKQNHNNKTEDITFEEVKVK